MRAREVIQQVIAVDPKFSGAHLILGAALWAQNHLEDALAEMRKEEEVSPNDTRPVQSAARLATFLRRGDEAIMEWRRLLKNGVTSKAH
jgi:Flp pilus assembly protein TadD